MWLLESQMWFPESSTSTLSPQCGFLSPQHQNFFLKNSFLSKQCFIKTMFYQNIFSPKICFLKLSFFTNFKKKRILMKFCFVGHGCSLVGLWCATRSSPRSSKKRWLIDQGLPEKWAEKDLPSHISSRLQRLFIPPEVNLGEKFVFISHDMFMFSWGKSLYLGLEWSKSKN